MDGPAARKRDVTCMYKREDDDSLISDLTYAMPTGPIDARLSMRLSRG